MTGEMCSRSTVHVHHVGFVRQIILDIIYPVKALNLPLFFLSRPGLQTRWVGGIHVW